MSKTRMFSAVVAISRLVWFQLERCTFAQLVSSATPRAWRAA